MAYGRGRSVQHTVEVAAPAGVVYGMLADAPRWPVLWPFAVHVERVGLDGGEEHLRVWETAGGRVRSLLVRRVLDPQARSIDFEQRESGWPATPETGSWSVRPDGEEHALLTLRHDLPPTPTPTPTPAASPSAASTPASPSVSVSGAATASGPAQTARAARAARAAGVAGVAEVAGAEILDRLERVRETAGRWQHLDELLLSFEDSVRIQGPLEVVYDFLYRIGDWADLLPHVERTQVSEDRPGIQFVTLDTCTDSGTRSVARSVRLCFPHAGRIVYKETLNPALIAAHSGEWYLAPDAWGVRAVCARRIMLREEDVTAVLGAGAGLADARRHLRGELGAAAAEALGLAKWHAESAVRRLR
ncbi:SRPBCC family protein [Streptomyces sp. NPDC005423]|uniref:aromatase/cyclase n=1 Tax=Streptomyces sp. NPDC005423 TaxID=3155343 RepID=UPI0033B02C31